MLKKLKIKNYRGFTQNTSFNFGKINIFVGPNSAGKSSILKLIKQLDEGAFYTSENFIKNISFNKKNKRMEIGYTLKYIKQQFTDESSIDKMDISPSEIPFTETMKLKIQDKDLVLDELKIKTKNLNINITDFNTESYAYIRAQNLNTSFQNIFSIYENFEKIKKYIFDELNFRILYKLISSMPDEKFGRIGESSNWKKIFANFFENINRKDLSIEPKLENKIKKKLINTVYYPELLEKIFSGVSKGAFSRIFPENLVQFWKLKKINTMMIYKFHPKILTDEIENWYNYVEQDNIVLNSKKNGYYYLAQLPSPLFKLAIENNKKYFGIKSNEDEKLEQFHTQNFNFFINRFYPNKNSRGYLKLLEFSTPYGDPGPYDFETFGFQVDYDSRQKKSIFLKSKDSPNMVKNAELSFLTEVYIDDILTFLENLLSEDFISLVKSKIESGKKFEEIIDIRFLQNIILTKSIYFLLAYAIKSLELLNNELSNLHTLRNFEKIYLPAIRNEFMKEISVFNKVYFDKLYPSIVLNKLDFIKTLQENINKWFTILEIPYRFFFSEFKDNLNQIFIQPILEDVYTKVRLSLNSVGFGFSQIIPVILQCQSNLFKMIIIEQPESQLHPKLQSQLADLFAENFSKNQFFIETHSEYLIRRFQVLVKEGIIKAEDIKIYYINKDEIGRSSTMELSLDENGRFLDEWPSGFFDESYNQSIALL